MPEDMPSIAQVPQDGAGSKKRQWEDGQSVVRVCSPQLKHPQLESSPHLYPDHGAEFEEKQLEQLEFKEREREREHERRILPIPSRRDSHKRPRIERVPSHDEFGFGNHNPVSPEEDTSQRAVGTESPVKKTDLSSCHICHRKPTLKAELNSFADCGLCTRRTCWICIRECLGSAEGVGAASDVEMGEEGHDSGGVLEGKEAEGGKEGERVVGHRGMVCSRCCVERGTEGEVRCFGCLRAESGR